jgi:hypothetical protein
MGADHTRTRAEPALVKALTRAHGAQRMLDSGRYASICDMAAAERIERGYLGRILRLALLASDIVEAILHGRQPGSFGEGHCLWKELTPRPRRPVRMVSRPSFPAFPRRAVQAKALW